MKRINFISALLNFFFITSLIALPTISNAQLSQTIKGRVIDQQNKVGLPGANVVIEGSDLGSATDTEGSFRITGVPIGRYNIKVMYMGYKTQIIPEILVGSAKEVVLTIEMDEDIIEGESISVTPKIDKSKPASSSATVSARSFSVEETRRYAGGMDDPARLASSFAGVTYGNAQDNAIIIRGNAPKGLLWRLEGIEIPNPNHFPDGNVTGGGLITIFSNQLLANSDFFTGAFPAEYGNALSGVFDMKLRTGNSDVREYTFQTGLMGIDFATEGPINSVENASYLVNYRYSTIGLLTKLQVVDTEQMPIYQDLSFKLNFPTKNAGTVSLWGIGSVDELSEIEESDSTLWETDWDRLKFDSKFNTRAIGLNHKKLLGRSTFINSTIATIAEDVIYDHDRLDNDLLLRDEEYIDNFNGKTTLTSTISHKFSARFNNQTGITWNYLFYDMTMRSTVNSHPESYQTFVEEKGNTQLLQAFTQFEYSLINSVKLNTGIHYEYFTLNKNSSLEPRLGISWNIHPNHTVSFGYGKHSQLEKLQYYLARTEVSQGTVYPNKFLNFTHADHYVLGYDLQLTPNTRIKIEPYYQNLYDVPVKENDSFSFVNLKNEFYINDQLFNKGTGTNIGIDLTIERFLSDDYYYLVTASLFDSKYIGGDGIERDTRYNRNYVINILGGKEYQVRESNVLGVNGRFTYMGGERTAPVLVQNSMIQKRVILNENLAFTESLARNQYLDISLTYRINKRNSAHVIALQVKNILGSPNDYGYAYNFKTEQIEKDQTVIMLPSISYKIEF